jgi:preprotein translocase subunit SecA
LSDNGVSFCEQALGIIDLYNPAEPWISYLLNSIKAKELYQKNKNYIVNSDNEIIIVDEFTGRTMPGRRWSDGLHQAVEAKEGVPIQEENQTLASISYQNLFLLYEKLSGMTGTAKTEEGEFEKIYNLNVVQIPTHRVIKRKDFSDLIYKNQYIKWRAIAQECLEMYQIGRPVLIGTTTIEKSELLASLLSEYQIPYRLLNARPENVESESEVVALAGCRNAVTIATNMAGRGTDIVLGGSPTFLTKLTLLDFFSDTRQENLSLPILEFFKNQSPQTQDRLKREYSELLQQSLATLESNTDSVVQVLVQMHKQILAEKKVVVAQEGVKIRDLGGLHVIGTERNESRRIDNQLRGRSGRQGDPGSSKFFLSLEDKLLRIFGGDQILTLMQNIGFSDTAPIQSGLLNNSLETAQKKVESYYFDTRKQLFEYDQALTTQRTGVYTERKRILQQRNLRNWVMEYAERSIYDLWICIQGSQTESFLTSLIGPTQKLLGLPFAITSNIEKSELTSYLPLLKQQIQITYNLKELEMECIEPGLLRELEKSFILQQIDFAWKEHLQKIVLLRDSIRWRAYGQKDPLTEYKKEAFNYFTIMLARIRHRVVYFVLSAKVILL